MGQRKPKSPAPDDSFDQADDRPPAIADGHEFDRHSQFNLRLKILLDKATSLSVFGRGELDLLHSTLKNCEQVLLGPRTDPGGVRFVEATTHLRWLLHWNGVANLIGSNDDHVANGAYLDVFAHKLRQFLTKVGRKFNVDSPALLNNDATAWAELDAVADDIDKSNGRSLNRIQDATLEVRRQHHLHDVRCLLAEWFAGYRLVRHDLESLISEFGDEPYCDGAKRLYSHWSTLLDCGLATEDKSTVPTEIETVSPTGVSLMDAALLLTDGDAQAASATVKRWQDSRSPKLPIGIGKCPHHAQRNLYEVGELLKVLSVLEGEQKAASIRTSLRQKKRSVRSLKPTSPTSK